MDNLTPAQRGRCMKRVKSKNTTPELLVRRILTDMGCHYRLHVKTLPGKPDIVLRKLGLVIFINGCFWHQHEGCSRSKIPQNNREYWLTKLACNVERQARCVQELQEAGLQPVVLWECEMKDVDALRAQLEQTVIAAKSAL